jgi:carbon storage regulator
MLVLSRRVNEAIMVGDVRILVVRIADGKVRLGIEAPADVAIDREEVREAKKNGRSENPTG